MGKGKNGKKQETLEGKRGEHQRPPAAKRENRIWGAIKKEVPGWGVGLRNSQSLKKVSVTREDFLQGGEKVRERPETLFGNGEGKEKRLN